MDKSEKRTRIVTGNTPNKPREKRTRDNEAGPSEEAEERPARRTLDFHRKGSPLQKVLVSFLVHRVIPRSTFSILKRLPNKYHIININYVNL